MQNIRNLDGLAAEFDSMISLELFSNDLCGVEWKCHFVNDN